MNNRSVPPLRILVVDDNHDGAESLAALLSIDGHELEMAHDGAEAVDKAKAFRPHVVLLDIGLPKLDGYQACREMRNMARGAEMDIIALTGWALDVDRDKAKAAGFTGHLVKPIDFEELDALLQSVIDRGPFH
jgi:CheY-like chemotaxis protein